jgi:shikimate kinase
MNIILTGFMGTGKTAVGKRLAKRLGWKFVDVDALIEAKSGMPIAQLFVERGEPVFRRLERRIIGGVARGDRQVIATGGGAVVDPKNRERMRARGLVVCLTARPQTILARVGHRLAARPMLAGTSTPLARVRALLGQRARAYAQADLTLDTSGLSVDEVAERLWAQLSPCLCQSWQYLRDHAGRLAQRYGGKYVVAVGDRIIGCGDTQLEAYQKTRPRLAEQEGAGIYYIPLPEESLTAL